MPVCNKCFIDKPQDQYFKEKRWGKEYYKRYCLDCFRKQSREWKAKNRPSKRKLLKELEEKKNNPNYKLCNTCNEYKLLSEFYSYRVDYKCPCKVCQIADLKKKKEEKLKLGFTTNHTYPNTYLNQEIKDDVFMIMNICGWTYNDNGVWSKEGIKDKDKKWINIRRKGRGPGKKKKDEKRTN